jgi:hypothetical protein
MTNFQLKPYRKETDHCASMRTGLTAASDEEEWCSSLTVSSRYVRRQNAT